MSAETTKRLKSALKKLEKLVRGEIEGELRVALDDGGAGQVPESSGHGDDRPSDLLWKILKSDGVSDKLRGAAKNVVSEAISGFVAIVPKLESGEECAVEIERLQRALRVIQLSGAREVKCVLKGAACTVLMNDSDLVTQSDIAWELLAAYQACGVEDDDLDLWELAMKKEDFAALAFMSFVLMGQEDSLDRLRDLFLSSLRDSDKIDFEFLAGYLVEKQGKERLSNQVSKWSKGVLYDSKVEEFLSLIPGLESEREDFSAYFELPEAIGHRVTPDPSGEMSEAGRALREIAVRLLKLMEADQDETANSSRSELIYRIQSARQPWMRSRAVNRIYDMRKSAGIMIGDANKSDTLTRQMVDAALEPNAKS